MAYQSADHYRTSSLSHPSNSPFGKTQAQQQQLAMSQHPSQFGSSQSMPANSYNSAAFNPAASFSASSSAAAASPSSNYTPSTTQSSPFSVRPELDPLEREKREVERRRQRLDDRKTRILHAKTRVMGVDVDSLNEQVRERAERERLEQERELYHDSLSAHHSKILSGLEEERKIKERITKEEMNFYRAQQSAEKRSRESRAASGWNNMLDGTNTTFLQFPGEDRDRALRLNAQATQQKDWLSQQLSMQSDREAKERQDDADYAFHQSQILALKKRNEEDHAAQTAARLKSIQEYNLQVSAQKTQSRARGSAQNHAADQEELDSTLSSALLNEYVPPSALGNHRSIPYNFKGFSVDQKQNILDTQAQQIRIAQDRRDQERLNQANQDKLSEQVRREMIRADRAREEMERAKLIALKDERQNQHKQKTLRDQYNNHVVYTNPVSEEYFQQFGTSGR